ncbi:mRNA-decapping enzyme subunit 1 [[Candida] railenensis]|uniref:mRNA-decapping enzyme subunit 1 n=1 Tax=[Candida] railenensis TaxID=45579 RepID=A0A9P0QK94_9ASCO|nr:mRNA-decapping enzyme subunit 1 [[Candida] railenensis]
MATATEITPQKALELYRNALNFNVINRYDPSIKQLLYHTSHCVIYKFEDETEEWIKSDYQGSLALYLRDFKLPQQNNQTQISFQDLQSLFCYGLMLFNRNKPECFSLGFLPNNITKHFLPQGLGGNGIDEMNVELNDNLIIVKNLLGEIYGLWVFNEADRMKLFKLLEFCLKNSDV